MLFQSQSSLFDTSLTAGPEGLRYEPDFLAPREERELIDLIDTLPLHEMQYKDYTAKRRIVSFGGQYDFARQALRPADGPPPELAALQRRAAAWLGVAPDAFTQILVAEYSPGTPLGWHRDVADFEDIVGVSLLSNAVLRFRPYPPSAPKKADIVKLLVEPRSIYVLRGPARWAWQHSIAPTAQLRYSITLRTKRSLPGAI
jgi:alkylated DNA repair dioxygenase AlkB